MGLAGICGRTMGGLLNMLLLAKGGPLHSQYLFILKSASGKRRESCTCRQCLPWTVHSLGTSDNTDFSFLKLHFLEVLGNVGLQSAVNNYTCFCGKAAFELPVASHLFIGKKFLWSGERQTPSGRQSQNRKSKHASSISASSPSATARSCGHTRLPDSTSLPPCFFLILSLASINYVSRRHKLP